MKRRINTKTKEFDKKLTETQQRELFKSNRPPLTITANNMHKTIKATALNLKSNLILIYGGNFLKTNNNTNQVFTVEGYFVTSFLIKKLLSSKTMAIFSEDYIVYLDRYLWDIEHGSPCTVYLIRYTDNCIKQNQVQIEADYSLFLDCDKAGNLYTNSYRSNVIGIYNSEFEFMRHFQSMRITKSVTSIAIREDFIVILAQSIYIFCLSTGDHIETVLLPPCPTDWMNQDRICLDICNNIVVYNSIGFDKKCIFVISALHHEARIRDYILPNPGNCSKYDYAFNIIFAITDNNQLITVTNGNLVIYNILRNLYQ